MTAATLVVLACVLGCAVASDLAQRRIPNPLVASGCLALLALRLVEGGASGLAAPAFGAALALGLALPPFLMRGLGAGDVKLFAFVGAAVGPALVVPVAAATAFAGGLLALGTLVLTESGRRHVARRWASATGAPRAGASVTASLRLPYAVAIAAGTAGALAR